MSLRAGARLLGLPALLGIGFVTLVAPQAHEIGALDASIASTRAASRTPDEQMATLRRRADALQAARRFSQAHTRPILQRDDTAAVLGAISAGCDRIGVSRHAFSAAGSSESDGVYLSSFNLFLSASFTEVLATLDHLEALPQLVVVQKVSASLPRGAAPGADLLDAEIMLAIPHERPDRVFAEAQEGAE